jgi:hypothetical protein
VILLSTWVYEHLEMSNICLGMLLGLPHLGMAGWGGIYRPQHKTSHWRKAAALCGTPDSPVGSPDSPVPLSGAHSRWVWHCRWPLALQAFSSDSSDVTLDSPMSSLHQCHLVLAVGLLFPWCTGQSGALSRTVRQWQHLSLFLGLCLILIDLLVIFIMSSFEVLLSSMP